jgi:hypothetical protein
MRKSPRKKKNIQTKGRKSDLQAYYVDLLASLLSSTGLNKFEVNRRIKFEVKADGLLDLEIDLHGLTTDDTESVLSKLLNSKSLKLRTITLIHGYNHGTLIKDYIRYDVISDRIASKMNDSANEGITILKIKPPYIDELNHEQGKKQKPTSKNQKPTRKNQGLKKTPLIGIEEVKNDTGFILEMIKETIKSSTVKSKKYNDDFRPILTDQEQAYSEEIFKYNFDLIFFVNHLREFYIFEETTYIKIRYKKKSIEEVMNCIHQLTENKDDKKLVVIIEVDKAVMKQMKSNNIISSEKDFMYEFDDNLLIDISLQRLYLYKP